MNVIVNRALDSSSNSQMEGEMFVNCISPLHAREICRYGGAETHVIGAILGGVASQEAVKLLTHQYVCINNTFVYNGVAGVGAVYEF